MSEASRVLRFPHRWHSCSTPQEADEAACRFLEVGAEERSAEGGDRRLSDPDVLSSICKLLREALDSNPKLVAERASFLHRWIRAEEGTLGLFDEGEYFLGETALLAAAALRTLGEREETEVWLQRAEAGFRHTVNPGPLVAQVAYVRLALQYDKGRYQDVLDLLPSTLHSFEKFGMRKELGKTRYLEAMTLKECSRRGEALQKLMALRNTLDEAEDPGLLGQVHAEMGACHAWEGRYEEAVEGYRQALTLLSRASCFLAVANLKITVGETLQLQGLLSSAVEAFREGVRAYAELGMSGFVAYGRLLLAETLIALGRNREAAWEILAALPTIEEQKMIPEGFAAVALLRESVRRRKTDPNALRELREHLQTNS